MQTVRKCFSRRRKSTCTGNRSGFPIPYGKITIIQGDPGEGKTTLVLHLAAALTRGKMLGSEEHQEPVTVIYQTAEDGLADTIKPRLIAARDYYPMIEYKKRG